MGCPAEVVLGDNLVFSICTHDPDTGVLTDADGAPAYRIYEDETATAILTGEMAVLDTGNTTGFYTEKVACTTANGFEINKSYTIYIEATVDSDKGGICYGFTIDGTHAILRNKMAVTNSTGAVTLYEDDGTTALYTVSACVTDNSITTLRKRLE